MAVFEPLVSELNKKTTITNGTFNVVDFDSKAEELDIYIEEFPKYGKLLLNDAPLNAAKNKLTYRDILNGQLAYRLEDKAASVAKDEIKVRITDGVFSTVSKYYMKKAAINKTMPVMEKNEGLQAISGN